MNQSINTDSKNSKEPQQKYRLGTVSIKILGGLNRFYGSPTSPSASVMAQNIQLFGPRGGFLTHQFYLSIFLLSKIILSMILIFWSVYLLLIRKMNYVYDGDFDVVRLDEIMTKTVLELFFSLNFIYSYSFLLFIFYIIYKNAAFGGYTSL